jgi:hypothetical protein
MEPYSLPAEGIHTGFLLVDPLNIVADSFPQSVPAMLRCTPAALTNADDVTPRLIEVVALSEAEQGMLPELMRYETSGERPPVICAWLDTPLDADSLIRHLGRYLSGRRPDGRLSLWRYYDPRVFSLVMSRFPEDQRQALLGRILIWRFPWLKKWWAIRGTGREADPLDGHTPAWPTARQWTCLESSEIVTPLMLRLQDELGLDTAKEIIQAHKHLLDAIDDAKRMHGLSDPHEIADYSFRCVRYGNGFLRHPKIVSALSALTKGAIGWNTVRDQLDDSEYAQLDREAKLLRKH